MESLMILFSLFVSKKGVRHSYRGGGGHVLFTKYTKFTLNLPYIFIQKNLELNSIKNVKASDVNFH
jgi:hypothetical protein